MSDFETVWHVEPAGRTGADRVLVLTPGDVTVLVVADGAGNSRRGAEAAESVLHGVQDAVDAGADLEREETWRDVLVRCDAQLGASGQGGETTSVVACVTPRRVVGASVGDSELWLFQGGEATALTEHQHRKPLLGSGQARPVTFERVLRGGVLLGASDGLFKYVDLRRIQEHVSIADAHAAVLALAALPRLASGALPDDVGLVLRRPSAPRP
ncbi:protein phosphatase 2C domain-containing protein [Corallococcus exiguus]|uniref:protein phosphatase 2C domain-containing protein n=1 Tax=Corallococcus exiguus TaxID=83462 RepID=UPI001A8E80FF|nr:protein phosphatase 2C domain-containing protein [Corallococcus exiguus]MBN8469533.1 protein phosphatase 2C domain-containing protein [Corallococcus exiguus]